MSGQCGKPSVRLTCCAALRAERRQRVLALHPALVEVVRPARAEHDRAVRSERTSRKPIPGWSRSAGSGAGSAASICSSVTRPGLAREGDQAEAARRHHRRARAARRPASRRGSSSPSCTAPSTLRPRVAAPTARPRRASRRREPRSARRPGSRSASSAARARPRPSSVSQASLHELLERDPVAVQERRALGLAVVGEDDEPVRAAARPRAAAAMRPIWRSTRAQRRERVGALDARVVGDLVVGEERRVADRPARRTCRRSPPATWRSRWMTVAPRAHERVDAAAVDARAGRRGAAAGRRSSARCTMSAITSASVRVTL